MSRPLPKTMKSPQDRRKGIWREGVLQIMITRACDLACFNCTQGSNLGGKPVMMSVEQFEVACLSLKDYFGVVGVFGGNPAMHPQFEDICKVMQKHIPWEQRGLWCNNFRGKGRIISETFNPKYSNLNVHLDQEAAAEMIRDWPACEQYIAGRYTDSRHSPSYVAMQDVIADEERRWELIGNCDVNQFWSSLIGVFRGELRAWFCEIAGAQSMLHANDPNYPDTGVPVVPGWWQQSMAAFDAQVRYHCHACGIPLRGYGDLAVGGSVEQVSQTHLDIYKPKAKDRLVQLVTDESQLKKGAVSVVTDYIGNSKK